MTLPLALVALISAFGSSFQYGYNVSVINSPAPVSAAGLEQSEADVRLWKLNVFCGCLWARACPLSVLWGASPSRNQAHPKGQDSL